MKVWTTSFTEGEAIPERYALCRLPEDPADHVAMSDNVNPEICWSELPEGTLSLALIVHDRSVPSVGDDVNQEGRSVPADLPRVDFFHWLLVDVDPASGCIPEGSHASGVTARGKSGPAGPHGVRHGVNSYTGWFAGDPDMAGEYSGYDGPAPPWNDELVHSYVFTLYALDTERLEVDGAFDGPGLRAALEGHVLDSASFGATYTLNPALR